MHVNTGHHYLRAWIPSSPAGSAQTQRERPNWAGAPKLSGSAQTGRERLNSKLESQWISSPSVVGAPKFGGSAQLLQQ